MSTNSRRSTHRPNANRVAAVAEFGRIERWITTTSMPQKRPARRRKDQHAAEESERRRGQEHSYRRVDVALEDDHHVLRISVCRHDPSAGLECGGGVAQQAVELVDVVREGDGSQVRLKGGKIGEGDEICEDKAGDAVETAQG